MQLGFVIDHTRCIGCHACTVACKSENEVPLGSFRTWVKYTEEGSFPEVRRSFAVLRCNQCTDAPCVSICPVSALEKGPSGIVDIDPKACIGCKSCMHGCPYDAIYLNDATGTVEKCHFCAHRVEQSLAPACAVVCPTEAIIPGDFDDPDSVVSRMTAAGDLSVRKAEAGTGPNVRYREVSEAGIDPGQTNLSSGSIWSENPTGPHVDAQLFESLEQKAREMEMARTVYDVPRKQLWGGKITGYLWAKSLAAGIFPAGWLASQASQASSESGGLPWLVSFAALAFLSLTGALLIADLKRPDRFFYILLRPNWSSWLARGTYLIIGYSLCLVAWLAAAVLGGEAGAAIPGGAFGSGLLTGVTIALALGTAAYTGLLFAQAKGRVLWMKRGYWLHLLVQALLAGSAFTLVIAGMSGFDGAAIERLEDLLVISLAAQWIMIALEKKMAPAGREKEFHRAARLVTHGPYSRAHWIGGIAVGLVLPLGLLVLDLPTAVGALAGILALVGLWIEEDLFVRAGQALPIS